MNNNARKPLAGLIALAAAVAMPLAFAQEAEPMTQDPTTTQDPTQASPTEQTAPAQPAQGEVTWADLDADGDGNLSQDEASAHPALSTVFAQADTDGDGQLTPDEYRNFAASQGATPPGGGQ